MTVKTHIETARLVLRKPEVGDLPAYTAYCASSRSHFVRGPFSAPEAFDKFAAIIGHWTLRGFGRYVMTNEAAPIGHVGPLASDESNAPEMTWTIWDAAAEGQGYATEAASAVAYHLMVEESWPEMLIRVQPENKASCRIAEKVGGRLTDADAPAWYPGSITYQLKREAYV